MEAILAGSSATLATGSCICLLLRRDIQPREGYRFAVSTLEDNSKSLDNTFCEMFSRH
jgi:hypothetical protein